VIRTALAAMADAHIGPSQPRPCCLVSQAQSVTQALDNAKWTSWSGLGNMPPMEAMRLYVRTLEEDEVRSPVL